MGHIVNPISFRLGVSKYWNSTWALSSSKSSYSYLMNQDIYIQSVFWSLFQKRFGYLGSVLKSVLPAGIKIVRSYNTVSLFMEFYYVQSFLTKYLIFNFFNRFFSVSAIKKLSERQRFVLSSKDLDYVNQMRPIFLKWVWLKVVAPISKKFWASLKLSLQVIYRKLLLNIKNLNIFIRAVSNELVTADFLARFIAVRLQQGIPVKKLMSTIKSSLMKLVSDKKLLGFHIKLSGRFSRVQQASSSVTGFGVLTRNEPTSNVDYAFQTANLKFSVCGVKVLLARPQTYSYNVDSNLSSNAKLSKWFNYIPSKSYSRWQRGKLVDLLNASRRAKKSKNTFSNFFI